MNTPTNSIKINSPFRLPLTVRWLNPDYEREFPPSLSPPLHIPIVYGPVKSIKKKKNKEGKEENQATVYKHEQNYLILDKPRNTVVMFAQSEFCFNV